MTVNQTKYGSVSALSDSSLNWLYSLDLWSVVYSVHYVFDSNHEVLIVTQCYKVIAFFHHIIFDIGW